MAAQGAPNPPMLLKPFFQTHMGLEHSGSLQLETSDAALVFQK